MDHLKNTKLFSLLSDASPVTNKEMQSAYESFIDQAVILNQSESDYTKIFRILSFTRIEFDSLRVSSLYGQGEKCLEIRLP
ncbi:hypothetical protein [uncultured Dysgonomonas sp.]|uniref:Uncharacterized protein n=1 Tax=uncultured Dysgonomonas sp. TaxID=206096 RepID=A0A212JSQ3_9BACT|nr:hypothetical protein [uncultured Dysgonomonas sp.]SBW02479.1 conserved hypothetical protein [uncultured Dysgonomonas sp.]